MVTGRAGGGVAAGDVDRGGFELDYVDDGGERRRESLSAVWNVRFEDVEPVRPLRWSKGQRRWAGWWWSSTSGRHVGFASWGQRDCAMWLDFDPSVTGFAAQPFWLHCPGGDRFGPAYFARLVDGTGVVIDVHGNIADPAAPGDPDAFDVVARACAAVGWEFRRVGAADPVRLANVRWLSRYRHPRCGADTVTVQRLLEVFARPQGLFDGAGVVGDRLRVLPVVYHLLWRQVLVADLTQLFNAATEVCCAAEEVGS